MTLRACQILVLLLAVLSKSLAESDVLPADAAQSARDLIESVVSAKTASGRFVVVGQDRISVYDFARWAEDLTIRFEHIAGVELPAENVPLIRVYFLEQKEAKPGLSLSHQLERGVLVQTMQVMNYESSMVESVLESISYCLTAKAVCEKRRKLGHDMTGVVVPKWLTDGIAQNMYAEMRKRNSETMLGKWQSGEMIPLQGLLQDSSPDASEESVRMGRGLLVGWLLSFGKDFDALGKTLDWLVKHGKVDSDDMGHLLETAGVADPDRGWDMWMLKQKRTVYLPGETPVSDLAWLKRQLLIYPEDFGIQLSDEMNRQLGPEDLIGLKKHEGVRAIVKSRFVELHLKAAGKGEAFRGVVEAYCNFLDGVARGKADWRLRRYLNAANEELRDFEVETLTLRIMDATEDEKEAVKE